MKKYKCISNKYLYSQGALTIGKIYDIFEQDILVGLPYRKVFFVTNNDNTYMYFSPRINDSNYIGNWFEDATAEIRNNKINQILKKI
jgi:hypothetical protein